MKLFPETWWLSLTALVQKIIKGLLTLLALYCAFLFFSFSFHSEGKGDSAERHEHTTFAIGTPEPWFHWEKTTEQTTSETKSGSSMHSSLGFSMHTNSGFNLFTRSFGAGVLCLLIPAFLAASGVARRRPPQICIEESLKPSAPQETTSSRGPCL